MNANENVEQTGGTIMGIIVPLAVLALWIILQAWVLPRFGVKT